MNRDNGGVWTTQEACDSPAHQADAHLFFNKVAQDFMIAVENDIRIKTGFLTGLHHFALEAGAGLGQ